MARDEVPNDVFYGADFRGVDAWAGGGTHVPTGNYRLQLIAHRMSERDGKFKVTAVHKILAGPGESNEYAGRPYEEWFDLGDTAVGKWKFYLEAIQPPQTRPIYIVQVADGSHRPDLRFITGAIFDVFIDNEVYKEVERSKMSQGQITLVKPSDYAMQRLQAAAAAQQQVPQGQGMPVQGVPQGVPQNGQSGFPPAQPDYNQPRR